MRHFVRVRGATIFGAEARLVDVQVALLPADDDLEPFFRLVGLPDSALREGRERIRSAIAALRGRWPHAQVTVNLAPAAARKEGAALDLPIALGVLAAAGVLGDRSRLRGLFAWGELGLDGCVRGVPGALAAVETARRQGVRQALVARPSACEAAAVPGLEVFPIAHLREAVEHLIGVRALPPQPPPPWTPGPARSRGQVRGQPLGLRATRVAAAGGHNLLLWGPPGAGKTLLARHLADLLPPLTWEEAVEVSRVHSVAGLLGEGLVERRPFRAPHHSTSLAGLLGGGPLPRPGEISLAHLGVLFLDELPEFPRTVLEALRQPLESGELVLGRAAGRARLPAQVLLVGAMNPCPCGWRGVEGRCRCTPRDVQRYRSRVSGPLRDRFDLQVRIDPVDPAALLGGADSDDAAGVAEGATFELARERQRARAERLGVGRCTNARLPARVLPAAVAPTSEAERVLVERARGVGLTGRGVHRVLRVARTIADLADHDEVEREDLLEALALRGD